MEVEGAPDLADFMNDWFFGTVGTRRSGGGAYDLTGDQSGGKRPSAPAEKKQQQQQGRSGGGGGSASKQTQEWLEEARRMVGAGSPGRKGVGSPSRQVPRFAAAAAAGTEPSPSLDRRDPMSRSARRHRQPGGIGDEILQRASISSSPPRADPFASAPASPAHSLPPNPPSSRRKSRFHDPSAPDAFSSSSAYRRAASSASTSPTSAAKPHHRRHASASSSSPAAVDVFDDGVARLNSFLRRQRAAVAELGSGGRPSSRSTKIVLSDASKSVSSIAAAICYAWMLASKEDAEAAVPVVNMRRGRMERCRQAAWLLHHAGVDASALLFADEVDMEGLMMDKRVSLVVVGQDVLKPNDKMGSVCTILTNNYCEDAYSLLQSLDIKKLLLAVLLDHNDHSFVEYLKNTYREPSTKGEGNSPLDQKHSVSASGSSQDAKKPNSNNQRPVHGNGGKTSDEAPRGKNKFFLAKWFGFGSK
uniref:Uncharacterized protein n=1 Tax=Oryza glumipatula TaxID=40148 RepID=A0A0D9YIY0_9ORYZ